MKPILLVCFAPGSYVELLPVLCLAKRLLQLGRQLA